MSPMAMGPLSHYGILPSIYACIAAYTCFDFRFGKVL